LSSATTPRFLRDQLEQVLDMEAVWKHWRGLPDREQQLLLLRS